MNTGKSEIISNENFSADYFKIQFNAPHITITAQPGQFVHVQITTLYDKILRRPFSIFDVNDNGILTLIYKVVGKGTKILSTLSSGTFCDILGPLGTPYSLPGIDEYPVIVAGGYGAAATYILAKRSERKGVLLLGARSTKDLILIEEYKQLGFDVKVTTEDGSYGSKGLITSLLESYFDTNDNGKIKLYGCGPNPMMLAMVRMATKYNQKLQLSFDHEMCCGIGACYACVIKVKDSETDNPWKYARTCKDGPVFYSDEIFI